jgi:galactokinase
MLTESIAHERTVGMFRSHFGREPVFTVRSPGRVNLIGDHTDYNDGLVLPMAIDQATWMAVAPRSDRTIVMSSDMGPATLDMDALATEGGWPDYVIGMLLTMGTDLANGFDACIRSDLPLGAGLSSSAALELAVARAIAELSGSDWNPIHAAMMGQRAENDHVGTPSGIMDQMIVATGRSGHALLLDCRSLEGRHALVPPEATVVILDTGTRRQLVDSHYAERRRSCEEAAAMLEVAALRDVDEPMLTGADLGELRFRRARHVVTENRRTVEAARAFEAGDLAQVGALMNDSHSSLRDDFEVSSPALDLITDIARAHDACFGARMSGGGFAGCGVALVSAEGAEQFIAEVGPSYESRSGHATTWPTMPSRSR